MLEFLHIKLGAWDAVLLVAVSVQATIVAYLHAPKWKAAVFSLPVPFSFVALALGRPIDATNAVGLPLFLVYIHGVRLLHCRWRWPIVPAIAAGALAYTALGMALAPRIPATDGVFWAGCALTFFLGLGLYLAYPLQPEPGHRSPLPVYIKLPVIMGVIGFLVLIKGALLGFATFFPLLGVATAYEARHSLDTLCRQVPLLYLAMAPMLAVIWLTQERWELAGALPLGWLVFLSVLIPLTRYTWARLAAAESS